MDCQKCQVETSSKFEIFSFEIGCTKMHRWLGLKLSSSYQKVIQLFAIDESIAHSWKDDNNGVQKIGKLQQSLV